ncbi:MAG TPA: PxKF domain-containing protein [Roseiflexaceae bacterium]|nr:PxKF domain-containing protein [Roseiflexaceae bacterium]
MTLDTINTQQLTQRLVNGAKRRLAGAISGAQTTMALLLVLGLVLFANGRPRLTYAQDGWPPIAGTLTVVDNSPGDQTDPHLSGDLVVYTSAVASGAEIGYHNVRTGEHSQILSNGGFDFLADVSGNTVAYTRHISDAQLGLRAIYLYDVSTTTQPVALDPQPGSIRERAAIGNQTVAWVEYQSSGLGARGEIVVHDLATATTTRLTNDLLHDSNPAVSPDGSAIVWEKCLIDPNHCDVWQATRSGTGWAARQLTGTSSDERHADTNGQVVVYHAVRDGESDIFWQPVGGGPEQRLALPSTQQRPAISGNLIAFEHYDEEAAAPSFDILIYDLASGNGYRIAQTPGNDILADVAVGANGQAHVVWAVRESDSNVYAFSFNAPSADRTAPSITISAPANTTYTLNQVVPASYQCADENGGSGLASCVGPVPSGSPADTAAVGAKTFSVQASDNAGNTASQSVSYTVTHGICVLYDQSKSHKRGSTVPIKLQLCDARGANVSSSAIAVHAANLTKLDGSASGEIEDSGNANPDHDFRYDATLGCCGGYIYNLSTRNLTTGTWQLTFTVAGDPVPHAVRFDIR